MRLGVLSVMSRRPSVTIGPEDLALLAREGARGYIHGATKSMRRERGRIESILASLVVLCVGAVHFDWQGPDLLAFLLAGVATTAVLDGLRVCFAGPWVEHSRQREFRVDEVLSLAEAVERGLESRPISTMTPKTRGVLIAAACGFLGIPMFWHALSLVGWVSWDLSNFGSYLLFFLVSIGLWRILFGLLRIKKVTELPIGHFDLHLDADDVLDSCALVLVLTIALSPLGSITLFLVPFLVLSARLIYRIHQYWARWRSLRFLGRYLRRHDSVSAIG